MDKARRRELQEEYKEITTYMGIYKITNNINNKIFVASSPNLKNQWITLSNFLEMGRHVNAELKKDWKEFGKDAFSYEVLEKKDVEKVVDISWELKKMEKEWLKKLEPYEDKGYNKPKKNTDI